MNKVQIDQHKEAMKWFIDNPDKGVWVKSKKPHATIDWKIYKNPAFIESWNYIQNDEYAEYRKAAKDGVQLQVNTLYDVDKPAWMDTSNENTSHADFFKVWKPELIRIKPKEHEFDVGDWVRNLSFNSIYQAVEEDLVPMDKIELWKPTPRHWCVFWDGNFDSSPNYQVAMYQKQEGVYHLAYSGKIWNRVAPMEILQTLKDCR